MIVLMMDEELAWRSTEFRNLKSALGICKLATCDNHGRDSRVEAAVSTPLIRGIITERWRVLGIRNSFPVSLS